MENKPGNYSSLCSKKVQIYVYNVPYEATYARCDGIFNF